MDRLKWRIIGFMKERYGYDDLNYTLLGAALIVDIIGMFTKSNVCYTAAFVMLCLVLIRALSKNRVKRAAENRKFRSLTEVPRRFLKASDLARKDKDHRYYLCPKCHQICRVPRGRGVVTVHCPKCGNDFSRKS